MQLNMHIRLAAMAVILISSCSTGPIEKEKFFSAMESLCDKAFEGVVLMNSEGEKGTGAAEKAVIHFRECKEGKLTIPFHIQETSGKYWDRSGSWFFTQHEETLELRHIIRNRDGSETEHSMEGGFTENDGSGSSNKQVFVEDSSYRNAVWKVEIEPGKRFTYSKIEGSKWVLRMDIDLTQSLISPPPAPWGATVAYTPTRHSLVTLEDGTEILISCTLPGE